MQRQGCRKKLEKRSVGGQWWEAGKGRGPRQRRARSPPPPGDKCCAQARVNGALHDFLTITTGEEGEKRVLARLGRLHGGHTALLSLEEEEVSRTGGGEDARAQVAAGTVALRGDSRVSRVLSQVGS